ncbi:MAG: response regulator transcription factor [Eggerthellaceae bacterium]
MHHGGVPGGARDRIRARRRRALARRRGVGRRARGRCARVVRQAPCRLRARGRAVRALAARSRILRFLSRGHGAKYIAERLCISADTVRTHCKRIYEKTGVHAKDELLELVEHAE